MNTQPLAPSQPQPRHCAPWATRRQLRDLRTHTGLTRQHKIYALLAAEEKQRRKEMNAAKKSVTLFDIFAQIRRVLSGEKAKTLDNDLIRKPS